MDRLKPGIIMCREKQDSTSAILLEKIVADEENHVDYLETQLRVDGQAGGGALLGAVRVAAAELTLLPDIGSPRAAQRDWQRPPNGCPSRQQLRPRWARAYHRAMSRIGTLRRRRPLQLGHEVPGPRRRDRQLQPGGLHQEPATAARPRAGPGGDRPRQRMRRVCQNTRDADGPAAGVDEELYEHALEWRTWPGYSEQERLAAEFATASAPNTPSSRRRRLLEPVQRALLRELLADLALSCALWVGMGRMLRTLDIGQACKLTLPSRA